MAILKSQLATSRRFGTTGATGTTPSRSQATLVLSRRPHRHVQGVETADRGVARGGRHEENRTIGDLHQAHDLVRVEVRWDVEDDARRVLPLGHLLADLFGFQNPAIDAEGPESHSHPPLPRIGIAEHGKILAHFAQAIEESFRRPTGGG